MLSPDGSNKLEMSRAYNVSSAIGALLGMSLLVFVVGLAIQNPYEKSLANLVLGLSVVVIGIVPVLKWYFISRFERPIPFFESHMLFYALCFGFAGFVTPDSFMGNIGVTEEMYTRGLLLTLVAQIAMMAAYKYRRFIIGQIPWDNQSVEVIDCSRGVRYAVILYFLAFALNSLFNALGISIFSNSTDAVRIFAFVVIVATQMEARAVAGRWRGTSSIVVIIEVVVYSGIFGGTLVGLLKYGWIVVLCGSITKRGIPWLAIAALGALFLLLQPVKGDFRARTWAVGLSPTPLQSIEIYIDVLTEQGVMGGGKGSDASKLMGSYSRVNHLHTFSAVIEDTPRVSDFRHGETLVPLLTKWIPRIAWPDKPIEDIGNVWGREYGYLSADDFQTSYNLPWLVEMYMNFGAMGVVFLSIIVGLFLGLLDRLNTYARHSIVYASAAVAVFTTLCFPESNISLQIGGAIVTGVSLFIVLRLSGRTLSSAPIVGTSDVNDQTQREGNCVSERQGLR